MKRGKSVRLDYRAHVTLKELDEATRHATEFPQSLPDRRRCPSEGNPENRGSNPLPASNYGEGKGRSSKAWLRNRFRQFSKHVAVSKLSSKLNNTGMYGMLVAGLHRQHRGFESHPSHYACIYVAGFIVGRSLLDYVVCMFFLGALAPYWVLYAAFLFWSGLLIPLALKQFNSSTVLLGGLSVFSAENFFYVWVSLFGNLNGCYDWYTGNPLNPDGSFGYSSTNPLDMTGYFLSLMTSYLIVAFLTQCMHARRLTKIE